ncbi:DNA glycosylase AlkZ-like family protein, partial [Aquitalea magnusonii]|uniref:DNA glycosylase AlkZ-like family protein n=1 Tax=Aquitalea magnusonii TaxID=332411 RepID=UPI0023BA43E9
MPRWPVGQLFEYWAHEACFVPREDYRLLRTASRPGWMPRWPVGQLFEYWAHEACFVPREDYRLL